MRRAFRAGDQNVRRRIPALVGGANVAAVVVGVGEVRVVRLDGELPMVERHAQPEPGRDGANRGATGTAELIGDSDVAPSTLARAHTTTVGPKWSDGSPVASASSASASSASSSETSRSK